MSPGDNQYQDEVQRRRWLRDQGNRRNPEHPVVVASFSPLAGMVAATVEHPERSSVLDVGCGNGFLQCALEKRFGDVAGLDFSPQMLDLNPCRRKYLGSSSELPFPEKSFDVVVASHLLHHLKEPDRLRTLREMSRVARRAVVSFEPNRNNPLMCLFALMKKDERMALEFSRGYMQQLFEQAHLPHVSVHVEGWIVPNRSPIWWIPVGRWLGGTPLRGLGFDVCAIGLLDDRKL